MFHFVSQCNMPVEAPPIAGLGVSQPTKPPAAAQLLRKERGLGNRPTNQLPKDQRCHFHVESDLVLRQ